MRLVVLGLAVSACTPAAAPPPRSAPPPAPEATAGLAPTAAAPSAPKDAADEEPAPQGPFSPDAVRTIVRAHFDDLVPCYLEGRKRVDDLAGTIEVRLTIGGDGHVIEAHAETGTTPTRGEILLDETVVSCVTTRFEALRFPETGQGIVNMIYPVVFAME